MGEVGDTVHPARNAEEKFDHAIHDHEPLGFHRNRRNEQHDDRIGVHYAESKQQTEHGTRSSDRRHHQGHHTDIAIAVFQPADQQLQHPGTDAAHHVVGQKALRPQLVFERTTEHPQGEHIEKQVGKSTVQKHISHQLVGMEQRTLDVEKRQRPDDSVPDRQQLGRKKHQRIDDNQVQHYGRRRRKIAAIIHRQSKI
ncbi:unknown [Alistipes putredinis CAG:67]|nr:unknown [Alistipes putredinis CAG:67]